MSSILILNFNMKITFCIKIIMTAVRFKIMCLSIVNYIFCRKKKEYDIN